MRSIVKNDTVKVISGNHKGKTGKVIMVIPDKNRVIVEKIQLVKRHTRPAFGATSRGNRGEGSVDPHLQRDAGLSKVRQADAYPQRNRTRRQEGPRVQ